jgi:hypothetical protein
MLGLHQDEKLESMKNLLRKHFLEYMEKKKLQINQPSTTDILSFDEALESPTPTSPKSPRKAARDALNGLSPKKSEKTHINETERQKRYKADFKKIRERLDAMMGLQKAGKNQFSLTMEPTSNHST